MGSARVRRAASGNFAFCSKEASCAFTGVGAVDSKGASSTVLTRSSKSAIFGKKSEVLLEEIHQVPFAVRSNESTRADADGLTISTTITNTVVLARVVNSVTDDRSVAVLSSVVRIASALVANTNNIDAASSVLTRLSTVSKVNSKGVLTQNTEIISRAKAVRFTICNITRSTVLTRINGA